MSERLCLFPYYGGKARFADKIIEIIEGCRGIDRYIEPFGGAASVLLNKAPHKEEIYNEQSPGMCALFRLLSDREKSRELIKYISENTEYSLKCFEESKDYRNYLEDNIWVYQKDSMSRLASSISKTVKGVDIRLINIIIDNIGIVSCFKYNNLKESATLKGLFEKLEPDYKGMSLFFQDAFQDKNGTLLKGLSVQQEEEIRYWDDRLEQIMKCYAESNPPIKIYEIIRDFIDEQLNKVVSMTGKDETKVLFNSAFKKYIKKIRWKYVRFMLNRQFEEFFTNTRDEIDFEDMELAAATYVVYKQSRNGMGDTFRGSMYGDNYTYQKDIAKLYDIAERLTGVEVDQLDAFAFFLDDFMWYYKDSPSTLIYADPTYLEQKPAISGNNNLNIEDAIKLINKEEKEYNPGRVYKLQWNRTQHERFLKNIQNAKCKMVVSNYRDKYRLYDTYLDEAHGWKSLEYDTKTTIGETASERTEVIWYNF